MTRPQIALNIFISCHPDDEDFAGLLANHLSPLKVNTYQSRQLLPGSDIKREIEARMRGSHIILLMISANYLNEEQSQKEQQLALSLQPAITVIPVLTRKVYLGQSKLAQMNLLPKSKKPIANWERADDACADIAESLDILVKDTGIHPSTRTSIKRTPSAKTSRRRTQLLYRRSKIQFPQLFPVELKQVQSVVNALEQCLSSLKMDDRAVANNILSEPHVIQARWRRFLTFIGAAYSLQEGIMEYFRQRVRFASKPDYFVWGEEINISIPLATFIDLNGLQSVILWAKAKNLPFFRDVPNSMDRIENWLDRSLQTNGRRDDFVMEMLSALGRYKELFPYGPTWATSWDSFAPLSHESADRWLQALGFSSRRRGHWILVLAYEPSAVDSIIRPTALDAGWNPSFFPAPPEWSPELGTPILDRGGNLSKALRSEFIHLPICHTFEHWVRAGKLIGRIQGDLEDIPLTEARRQHIQLLRTILGRDSQSWLDKIERFL